LKLTNQNEVYSNLEQLAPKTSELDYFYQQRRLRQA